MRHLPLVLGLLVATAAHAAPGLTPAPLAASVASGPAAVATAAPLALQWAPLPNLFGAPGLTRILDHIEDTADDYRDDFLNAGTYLYVLFFVLQFLLLGITMVVKGPFAIATYRPIHALNPFANFFFFLLAGTLGYLLVVNPGWVAWLQGLFSEAGERTGCTESMIGVGACDAEALAWIGMRMSGIIAVLTEASGNSPGNPISWLAGAGGASTSVFAAFSALAIQLTLTEAAFVLAIVTAPLFLSVIVFRPLSGLADGFVSFVVYIGVKLFILKLVAGVAGFVGEEWLNSILTYIVSNVIAGAISGGSIEFGSFYGFSLTIITASLLFLSLTMYLPTKIAGMVSQRVNLDLNGLLFRGEFPIQIA